MLYQHDAMSYKVIRRYMTLINLTFLWVNFLYFGLLPLPDKYYHIIGHLDDMAMISTTNMRSFV